MKATNNAVVHYTSFADAAKDFGCKPASMRSNNKKKLESQREKFASHHKCKACGKPMSFVEGTNIFTCTNPACNGIKVEKKDTDGVVVSTTYLPSYHVLDDDGAAIAANIFGE